jgi:hypothetical protein
VPFRRRAAALLASLALLSAAPLPAVAATAPPDVLTLQGDGGYLMDHRTASYGAADGFQVVVGEGEVDQLGVLAGGPGEVWLTVGAPGSSPRLSVGRYPARVHDAGPDDVVLMLTTPGRGCNQYTGYVDVLALTRDAGGRLASLALDYATTCDGDPGPVTGSLRWNSDVPYQHTAVTELRAPDTAAGLTARGSVTLTNGGSLPQAYGRTTWQPDPSMGEDQLRPTIVRDGCAGITLAPGGTCTVEVSMLSDGVRGVGGYLRTPDQTLRSAAYSLVTMRGVPAPSRVTLNVTPERGAVRLTSSTYHPSYRVLRAERGRAEVEIARDVAMPWTDSAVTAGTIYAYRVVPMSGGASGPPSDPRSTGPLPVPVGASGAFVPVDPVRVLDTRIGTGARKGAVPPGGTVTFDPAAGGHIPASGVSAVLLNLTGTDPTAGTYIQAWPAGGPRPATSSLNLAPGQTRPNQVVVPVGADGEVALYNSSGSTHLVVDLQGFYSDADGPHGGGFHTMQPQRVLDTRSGRPLGPGEEIWAPVSAARLLLSEVTAVEVNLTVVHPTAAGYITAWPGDTDPPLVSNVNFGPGQTIANHAVVPVTRNERGEPGIALLNSTGSTHVLVDLVGWYDDGSHDRGLRFEPTRTSRVADTRTGRGQLAPTQTLVVSGDALPPAAAHVVNITATGALNEGYLTTWPGDGTVPWTSTVNFKPREDAPNLTTAVLGSNGTFAVTSGAAWVDVVVDHLGYFY